MILPDYIDLKGFWNNRNFAIKLDLWEKCADTPFWFGVSKVIDKDWAIDDFFKTTVDSISIKHNLTLVSYANDKGIFIGLKPTLFETEDIVVRNISTQIEMIINEITNTKNVQM